MRVNPVAWTAFLCTLAFSLAGLPLLCAADQYSEVPAGTRFLVELGQTLAAKKLKAGAKFAARTVEVLQATDGSVIPAGARLYGRVTHIESDRMLLQVQQIEARRGKKVPLVATVAGVVGEKGVEAKSEGEIRTGGSRAETAAIGAAVGAGAGAVVGAAKGGGKGAAIGAGTGAAAGALIGLAAGGKELVLERGTRLELVLDRALLFRPKK